MSWRSWENAGHRLRRCTTLGWWRDSPKSHSLKNHKPQIRITVDSHWWFFWCSILLYTPNSMRSEAKLSALYQNARVKPEPWRKTHNLRIDSPWIATLAIFFFRLGPWKPWALRVEWGWGNFKKQSLAIPSHWALPQHRSTAWPTVRPVLPKPEKAQKPRRRVSQRTADAKSKAKAKAKAAAKNKS